jgi:lipid kinase YegS
MRSKTLRVILNGKKSALPQVRQAVAAVRKDGHEVDVRVTWESGDAARFAAEALDDDIDVIVAGGGDGTINEVVNGIFERTEKPEKTVGVMPLGSANDFARGCGIPMQNPTASLRFAASSAPHPIDIGRVNDRYFINALVAGFGAEVTFQTSARMKKVIHGAAYGITGFLTALKHSVYHSHVRTPREERKGEMIFSALANGHQAGGFSVAPRAKLDDGLLDLMSVPDFHVEQLPDLLRDITHLKRREPTVVRYEQLDWIEVESKGDIPISPDGEELITRHVRVDVLKQRLKFVLPDGPLLGGK